MAGKITTKVEKALSDRLIDNWNHAWKFASIRIQAAGVVLMTLAEIFGQSWTALPEDIRNNIPHASTIALVLFTVGMISRIFKKKEKDQCDG